jgi:ABC-type nitrate/sulfonate/bicarbonate transport system ATPase subunit
MRRMSRVSVATAGARRIGATAGAPAIDAATSAPTTGAADSGAPVIQAIGVDHFYEGQNGWNHALDRLTLTVQRNEFLCILGPSGCGKSTFLKIIAGLTRPSSGTVLLNGKPIKAPGPDRGIVFQEPALFAWLTVVRNVEFGLLMGGWKKPAARARAMQVLEIVGLADRASLYPFQLSGGMKHRVAVARAWALTGADLLLMDEPFSAIDAINRMSLQAHLVDTWRAEPRTVLYVTHDIEEAVYLADRIVVLKPSPGRLAADLPNELPRPRDRAAAGFAGMKAKIMEEMQRHGLATD